MTEYLDRRVDADMSLVARVFEEATLWSARFGALLLDHIDLRPDIDVLDIGCGGGFPLIELANVHGQSCRFVGIDLWTGALRRAHSRVDFQKLSNVQLVEGDASALPFANSRFDLITSNLGINNFNDPDAALRECRRVTRRGGRLAVTTNIKGHMQEFYDVFREVVMASCPDRLPNLVDNENHRGTRDTVVARIHAAGFRVSREVEDTIPLHFLDGSALLRHNLCQWFLLGWQAVVDDERRRTVFSQLEDRLNALAASAGELRMNVPMLYVEAVAE